MIEKGLISILIATYNAEDYLDEALESVVKQDYTNWEIIIIDGDSKDETLKIIQKFDNVIAYSVSERDSGVYDAWNKGIRQAKGEWIVFIGADDILEKSAFSTYIHWIGNQSFDFVCSKAKYITREEGKLVMIGGQEWNWEQFRRGMTVVHPGAFHNNSLFTTYGLFDIKYKIAGDLDLLLRPGNALKAGFVNDITISIREGGVSAGLKSRFEHYEIVTKEGRLSRVVAVIDFARYLYFHYIKKKLILLTKKKYSCIWYQL